MNCKPGDLAVYVGYDASCLGAIVRCVANLGWGIGSDDGRLCIGWLVEPALPDGSRNVADRSLRPIRDPGDDAQDETLDWLPVPSKEFA